MPLYGLITEDGHAAGVDGNGFETEQSASTARVEAVGGRSDRDPTGVIDELLGGENIARVSLYREKPTSAGGHLETIDVHPGEGLDLESIHREWGGGTIRFRPLNERGKYAGRSVTVRFAGPPLWHGRPLDHRGQPLDGTERVIDVPATTRYGSPLTPSTSRGGDQSEAVRVLGDAFGAMMERLDRIEDRISEPRSNPSDPAAMLAQLSGMARTMGQLKKLFGEADSLGAVEDEPEPKAPSWQDMLPMLLLSKLGGDQGGGMDPAMLAAMAPPGMVPPGFPGMGQQPQAPYPPQPPQAPPQAPPRPPQQAPHAQTVAPSEMRRPSTPPRPEQVAAMLRQIPPEQRGAYVAQVMQAMGVQAPGVSQPAEHGGDDGARAQTPHAPADPFAMDDDEGGAW